MGLSQVIIAWCRGRKPQSGSCTNETQMGHLCSEVQQTMENPTLPRVYVLGAASLLPAAGAVNTPGPVFSPLLLHVFFIWGVLHLLWSSDGWQSWRRAGLAAGALHPGLPGWRRGLMGTSCLSSRGLVLSQIRTLLLSATSAGTGGGPSEARAKGAEGRCQVPRVGEMFRSRVGEGCPPSSLASPRPALCSLGHLGKSQVTWPHIRGLRCHTRAHSDSWGVGWGIYSRKGEFLPGGSAGSGGAGHGWQEVLVPPIPASPPPGASFLASLQGPRPKTGTLKTQFPNLG